MHPEMCERIDLGFRGHQVDDDRAAEAGDDQPTADLPACLLPAATIEDRAQPGKPEWLLRRPRRIPYYPLLVPTHDRSTQE